MEISGAKEGGTESAICECPLGGSLCDRSLPRPSEPIQPVDRAFVFVKVVDPQFDLIQDCCTCSFETTAAVSVLILGFFCISDVVEDICFSCGSFFRRSSLGVGGPEDGLTWILRRGHFACPNVNGETYYLSELLVADCLLLRHLLSSSMLKRESG